MKTQYRKCCEKYGEKITDMLNEELFKCNKRKSTKYFLRAIGNFLFDVTGNVNVTQRINIIANKKK